MQKALPSFAISRHTQFMMSLRQSRVKGTFKELWSSICTIIGIDDRKTLTNRLTLVISKFQTVVSEIHCFATMLNMKLSKPHVDKDMEIASKPDSDFAQADQRRALKLEHNLSNSRISSSVAHDETTFQASDVFCNP